MPCREQYNVPPLRTKQKRNRLIRDASDWCAPTINNVRKDMSSKRRMRKRAPSQAEPAKSASNSLDWDSPSTKTGTVKRRPASGDSFLQDSEEIARWGGLRDKAENPGRRNERRENYSGSDAYRDKWDKCEPERRPNRSVSVYDPSVGVRGFAGDVGQAVAARGVSGNVLGLKEFCWRNQCSGWQEKCINGDFGISSGEIYRNIPIISRILFLVIFYEKSTFIYLNEAFRIVSVSMIRLNGSFLVWNRGECNIGIRRQE